MSRVSEQFQDPDIEAYEQMEAELEQKYPHQTVVFHQGRLAAVAKSHQEAMRKARQISQHGRFFVARLGPYDDDVICAL